MPANQVPMTSFEERVLAITGRKEVIPDYETYILPRHCGARPLNQSILSNSCGQGKLDSEEKKVERKVDGHQQQLVRNQHKSEATKRRCVESQFDRENAEKRQNPFRLGRKEGGGGRMCTKLNLCRITPDLLSSIILPGPHFDFIVNHDMRTSSFHGVRNPVRAISFDNIGLRKETVDLVRSRGIEKLTAIQQIVIPTLRKRTTCDDINRGLFVQAPTGSGKTLAVLVPICDRIFHLKQRYPAESGPYAILLAHNTLACVDLYREVLALCPRESSIKVGVSCGSIEPRVTNETIERGVDILICTSGRLDNHLLKHAGNALRSININMIRYFVLDEADLFVEDPANGAVKYGRHVEPAFAVLKAADVNFKVIMLTNSTVNLCDSNILQAHLTKASYIRVGGRTIPPTSHTRKFEYLQAILKNRCNRLKRAARVLVYTAENNTCVTVAGRLKTAGYRAVAIASQEPNSANFHHLKRFVLGQLDVVVTQDVAARAINVPDLDAVIVYDVPKFESAHNLASLCGRTGRLGHLGHAIIFFDPLVNKGVRALLTEFLAKHTDLTPEVLPRCATFSAASN